MKVAVITWEKNPDLQKHGDLQSVELKHVFDDVIYFNPYQVRSGDSFDAFDIVQFWTGTWCGDLERRQLEILDQLQKPFVVMVPIGESFKWETWQADWLHVYLDQVWHPNVDLLGVVEKNALSYWGKLSDGRKPVAYIGWPYPVEYVKSLRQPAAGKRIELRVCASFPRYLSAALLRDYPPTDWCVHVNDNENRVSETRLIHRILGRKSACSGGYSEWEDYLKHVARSYIGVAVDSRYTLGRYALDYAALGRPLLCGETAVNRRLFPDLVCYYYDLETQAMLLHKLYHNTEFYTHCVTQAETALNEYTYAVCRKRYMDAIARVRHAV